MSNTPSTCAVHVGIQEWPYVTMCGGATAEVLDEDTADELEHKGWSFAWDAVKEVPVCKKHQEEAIKAILA